MIKKMQNPQLNRFLLTSVLSALITVFLLGCASDEKKADTAEEAYKIAQDLDKEEHFKPAIARYQDVKNKFPYSNLATLAELAIADVYYKTGKISIN